MKKLITKKFVILLLLFFLPVIIFILLGMMDSKFSHCIVVEEINDFNGDYLSHKKAVSNKIVETVECEKLDNEIDEGNGKKTGKVRWYVCPRGPDCDEMGMY